MHCHSHDHSTHNHHELPRNINLAFAISVFLNLAFTFVEAGYAIYANSMSLLADAGHNLSDVLGLLLAWGASWLLTRPSSERYSYGYKRTTILASMLNALLLVAASAIIAYESIHKIIHPSTVNEQVIFVVALIGIFINGGTALLFMRGQKTDLNLKGAYLHLLSDAIISLGVVIAAVLIKYTHFQLLDPLVGLVIVILIVFGTWGLLRQSFDLLLDAVPHSININTVKDYLSSLEDITTVHDLHIWSLSTRETALTAHLVNPKATLTDVHLVEISKTLKHKFGINHATLQIEKGSIEDCCTLNNQC